jgi:acyl carrier protein
MDALQRAGHEQRLALLAQFIENEVLEILEWPESRRPEVKRAFVEIGLDSLTAVNLQYRLQTALDFVAASPDDFRQPSAEALAKYLLKNRIKLV